MRVPLLRGRGVHHGASDRRERRVITSYSIHYTKLYEQTRRKFQEDLLGLVQNENKTFLFVTHSIEEAVYVSDQIAIV